LAFFSNSLAASAPRITGDTFANTPRDGMHERKLFDAVPDAGVPYEQAVDS